MGQTHYCHSMKSLIVIITGIFAGLQSILPQYCTRGTVMDLNRNAIPFATVSDISGNGTICDSTGNFEFCFPLESKQILIVQALGFITDSITINNREEKIIILLNTHEFKLSDIQIIRNQDIKNRSMASTITTNKKEIARLNPQNVGEVLQTKTGFTNRSGYQTPLTLRGMTGKQLLVLRNGLRRFSSYPSGYMSHTINVHDLERIEVEKGAASVIYGAGAMAGIINLVDKSPFKQKGLNAKITTGYGTVNQEKNLLVCGGWSNGKLAVKTGLRYRTADNFSYPDGSIAENSFYTDKDLFVTAGYKISGKQDIIFTTDIHDGGPWGKPVGFNGSDYMRVQTKKEQSDNFSIQYQYRPEKVLDQIEISTFYSDEKRKLIKNFYTAAGYMLSYVETTTFSDYYYGSRLTGNFRVSKSYRVTTGSEFYSFHISTPTDAVDYIEGISFQNRVCKNARSFISGTFIENTFSINLRTKFVAGIRYDYASVYEGEVYSTDQEQEMKTKKQAISGNIAASYKAGRHSKLKLNIARSFRIPETTELYADNYTSNGILFGNPDLKPEYCYSMDLCINYSPEFIEIEASPFIWLMDDMINKEEIFGMPGTNYQYTNVGKSRLWGGEFMAGLPCKNLFTHEDNMILSAGIAYLNGTNVSETDNYFDEGEPLDYVPPFNLKSNIAYNNPAGKFIKYHMALRTVYYAEQTRLGKNPYATPAYWLFGCTLSLNFQKIKTTPTINLAINNLLNNEYYCYQSYLPGEGRDFRIFLTFHFE